MSLPTAKYGSFLNEGLLPAFLALLLAALFPIRANAQGSSYQVNLNSPRQSILGLGVEIEFDSIGSGNDGLPSAIIAVPNNLVESERERWYQQMLSGFRYCRLAMGLYLRGLDTPQQHFIGRWPTQMEEIQETIAESGMQGVAPEYWSPAPYWKTNDALIDGTLASFQPAFLDSFGDAIVADMQYLESNGIPLSYWGLQNEPQVSTVTYSCCGYSGSSYDATFAVVAPKIRAAFPGVPIHADSYDGPSDVYGTALRGDTNNQNYPDAWTYHEIGDNSNDQIANNYRTNSNGLPVFNNEFEYLTGTMSECRVVNTAQSIMNWFAFQNSQTWFWLHALKPITDSVAQNYALGFWRPPGDTDYSTYPDLAEGYWTWNPYNWNAISGFLRYMPWNCTRLDVTEPTVDYDQRVLAWLTPDGRVGVVLTNRTATSGTYQINLGHNATYDGYQFNLANDNLSLGNITGAQQSIVVPAYSIDFWVESSPRYEWRLTNWPLRPEGQQAQDLADPQGDGRPNLLEYAVGGNPLQPDSKPVLAIAAQGDGSLKVCPTFPTLCPDVRYLLETSSDLQTWTAIGDTNAGTFPLGGVQIPGGAGKGFYRLTVSPTNEDTEVVVDNADATGVTISPGWTLSNYTTACYGTNYLHDGNTGKGSKTVLFTPNLPVAGTYQVYAMWNSVSGRASNVPFTITDAAGSTTVNMDETSNSGVWVSLGSYSFNAGTGGSVQISNASTSGYVIADAVRFVNSDGAIASRVSSPPQFAGSPIPGALLQAAAKTRAAPVQ